MIQSWMVQMHDDHAALEVNNAMLFGNVHQIAYRLWQNLARTLLAADAAVSQLLKLMRPSELW